MSQTLIHDATLVELDPPRVETGDLLIEGETIVGRGTRLAAPDAVRVDGRGRVVMPGLVIGHHHLYSTLARGMPPAGRSLSGFPEILEHVWWVLDRALDLPQIRLSGAIGAMAAAAAGVTTIVDHHASPSAIEGSLTALATGIEQVGLRSVLCYEATERGTADQFEAGVAENLAWAATAAERPGWRGALFGIHAAFTLGDAGLARCGAAAAEAGLPVHIHMAEDPCDLQGGSPAALVDRLEHAGLLTAGSVFAHGIHVGEAELARITAVDGWLAHNTRSNMNNHVGYSRPSRFGPRRVLGTDGIDGDLLAEARTAFFKAADAADPLGVDGVLSMIGGAQRLASDRLGVTLGRLEPGAPADLALFDYDPPTPLTRDNIGGQLLFGGADWRVTGTLAGGQWVYRDGDHPAVDAATVRAESRDAAERLWARMAELRAQV